MSTITKGKDQIPSTVDKAKEAAESVANRVGHAASSAANAASSAANMVGQKAESYASSAGEQVRKVGEAIQHKGPQEGMLGHATHAVGSTVEAGGKYLEETGLKGMMDDLTHVIKHNPLPAVLIGLGLGVLIGRVLRS